MIDPSGRDGVREPFRIVTPRLVLRFVRDDDVAPLTAYRNDPRVAALQDWDLPYPEARARELVAKHAGLTDLQPGRRHQIAIELNGHLVGDVYAGLDEHCGVADIGFSLTPAAQGRGIAHEAVSAVIDHLVERLGVRRVAAELSPQNGPSERLLERLGMTFESLTARSFWCRGAWDDSLTYAITSDQWRAWRDRPRTPPAAVRLVEITEANRWTYAGLRVHRSQERFVTGVQDSYADAYFPGLWRGMPLVAVLRGIEADGEPVGFLMYSDFRADDRPYLWRFLIDRRHQGRGIGRRALVAWFEAMRAVGHTELETSWVPGPGGPEPFYLAAGFVPTGEVDDGETVARLRP